MFVRINYPNLKWVDRIYRKLVSNSAGIFRLDQKILESLTIRIQNGEHSPYFVNRITISVIAQWWTISFDSNRIQSYMNVDMNICDNFWFYSDLSLYNSNKR